jgi:hypothetical protein
MAQGQFEGFGGSLLMVNQSLWLFIGLVTVIAALLNHFSSYNEGTTKGMPMDAAEEPPVIVNKGWSKEKRVRFAPSLHDEADIDTAVDPQNSNKRPEDWEPQFKTGFGYKGTNSAGLRGDYFTRSEGQDVKRARWNSGMGPHKVPSYPVPDPSLAPPTNYKEEPRPMERDRARIAVKKDDYRIPTAINPI